MPARLWQGFVISNKSSDMNATTKPLRELCEKATAQQRGMSTRRNFLKTISSVLTASPLLLEACAAGLESYRGEFNGAVIQIPKNQAAALALPNGMMMVRAKNLPMPIVVRNVTGHGLIALSTICTHKGCEVRVLPDAFQCPCHGSEYRIDGGVVEGPASQPLQRFAVEETPEAIIIKVKS
jgi:cytochrome b6-f complex iron-sulfur subunit